MDATPILSATPEAPEPMSLFDRLIGIITGPSEVFDEVESQPVNHWNWLLPLLLATAASLLYFVIAASQPAIQADVEVQFAKARAKMEADVASGKMTQQQFDAAQSGLAIGQNIAKYSAVVVGAILPAFGLAFLTLFVWLETKICSSQVTFLKVLEVCGLGLVIDVIQKIVRVWLVMWKQSYLATVSPALFFDHPDMHNKTHVALSILDPIDFWWLAVLTIGLSKVARLNKIQCGIILFGTWFVFRGLGVLLVRPQ